MNSNTVEGSTYLRYRYIQSGLETFIANPIIGIGLNNSRFITMTVSGEYTYLHNNYVELLACTGIIGFSLYYYEFIYIFKNIFKYLKKEPFLKLALILSILLFLMDFGVVSYCEIKESMYLLIIYILVDKAKLEHDVQK